MNYLTIAISIIILILLFAVAGFISDNDVEADSGTIVTEEQKAAEFIVDPVPETVRSADGTLIGYTKVGSGPVSLVMVHGAINSGEQWMPVAEALNEHCTCYVMDRWGRGASEAHEDYSLEREVEDIEAVLEAAGPDAFLLGHSSGAIYALETTLSTSVAGLILYEPPIHGFHGQYVDEVWPKLWTAAQEERFEDVITIFLRDEAGVPPEALAQLKTTPLWDHHVALAPHSVREWDELIQVKPTVERYRNVSVPTLLLAGTLTENHPSFATEALHDLLPEVRIAKLEGQGHTANLMAPELVAETVSEFFNEIIQ